MLSFDTPSLNFDTREPEMPKNKNSQKAIFKTANFPKAAVQKLRGPGGGREAITIQ